MGVSRLRRESAMQTIENMPLNKWMRCEDLARITPYAGFYVTTLEMMAYLKEAKTKGRLEYRPGVARTSGPNGRKTGVWRRIE